MEPKRLSSSKINPTKLLGSSSFVKKTTNISEKLKEDSITISASDLSTIKKQVFEIKDLVTNLTTLKKKKLTTERKETEREKFGEREKELEKKKKPEDNKIKLPQAPKLGFLDIVKRFVVNTLIGFVVVRLIKHLPKLIEVAKFVGGAMDFITNVGGKLLNGLATFVQKGYEAYDFTRKTLKSFGGENALKLFDGFNDALGGIVTAALAASFAIFDMAGGDSGGDDTVGIRGRTPGRSRRGIDPKLARKYAERYGRDAAVSRFGREGVRSLGGRYARSGVENLARTGLVSLAGKSGAKSVLKFVKPLVNKIPIIGGLIEFGLSWALGEPVGKAAFRGIGSVLLGGIGTAIGGPVGAFIGAAAGGEVGGALYDLFFANKKPAEQKVAKAAGGGQPVTRGGRLVSGPRRTITKSKVKRQIAVQPTQLKPGADIGGEEKIEKVFPKSKDKNQVSPLDYIEKSYKNTNQDRFFGSLLNLQTKSLVGQKPSKVDYANAAQGLSNWMTMTFSDEILRTGAVYAAGGGEINADMLSKKSGDMTDAIAKSLEDSISKRLDDNINDLMKQMMLKGIEPDDKDKKGDEIVPPDDEFVPGDGSGGQWGPLLELIASKESGGNYEAMYPSTTLPGATKMTIAEVARRATGAVGKYQQLPRYLISRAKAAGLNPDKDLYSPENQDLIVTKVNIGMNRGGNAWLQGKISDEVFMQRLSMEFAALPNSRGQFYYNGQRSSIRPEQVKGALSRVKQQSIASSRATPMLGLPGNIAVTSGFGMRGLAISPGMHMGIDIGAPTGTPLKSFTDGKVEATGWQSGYGNYVNWIDSSGVGHFYAHMNSPASVKKGQRIKAGTILGYVGNTGTSSGPHLHWETATNPRDTGMPKSAVLSRFNPLSKYKKESPFTGSRFHGGFVSAEGKYNLHIGEYVVDKDSVDLVGKDFIATINAIENKTQLQQRVGSLINHLSYIAGYEPGGQQEIVVEMPEPEVVTMPMPIPVGGGGMVMLGSGSGEDYSQELYSHA
jgi:murein DD-endopeptidase MepM/ murein hydrolase activator NlpD